MAKTGRTKECPALCQQRGTTLARGHHLQRLEKGQRLLVNSNYNSKAAENPSGGYLKRSGKISQATSR
jgi:hypothetical protein